MSLERLINGYGFRNTGVYEIHAEYPVYEVHVEWSERDDETIRCHEYRETPNGLAIKRATCPYISDGMRIIQRGYNEERVICGIDEYEIDEKREYIVRESEVRIPDHGVLWASRPRTISGSLDEWFELVEVE